MFKKKKVKKESKTEWDTEMISSLTVIGNYALASIGTFYCSPFNRDSYVAVSKEGTGLGDIYISKDHYSEELVDVLVSIIISDEEYHNESSEIGYFRLVNHNNLPNIYVYLKNKNNLMKLFRDYYCESMVSNRKFLINIDYDKFFFINMKENEIVGNKKENDIPITNYTFGFDQTGSILA